MEENNVTPSKHALSYGAILGGILVVLSLLTYIVGFRNGAWIGYLNYVAMALVIYFGIKVYRDKFCNGLLAFGKAFTTGLLIGVFGAVIIAVYSYLFYKFFDPGAIQELQNIAEEKMRESSPNLSEEEMDKALRFTSIFTRPGWMAGWSLFGTILISAIFSLIAGAILKKEEKVFGSNI